MQDLNDFYCYVQVELPDCNAGGTVWRIVDSAHNPVLLCHRSRADLLQTLQSVEVEVARGTEAKFATLVKALNDRSALKLEIIGRKIF
ncbi:hypothetical protein NTGHW29_70069 [Candidatus Nitrotoga sp. HW29]|uniref:hypothetical protein n=1 Tax=Candidatus Nitrotoga sp. HW29 TaxID=2886963 RepID=UPI001EF333BF|nr:hypothetical protein [Candidatus Nitrotoga sp. HW29]CAH1905929.1 hypothetical protein NTGHW29_70069 [Candidatus Nitrotoga sp. HW29]